MNACKKTKIFLWEVTISPDLWGKNARCTQEALSDCRTRSAAGKGESGRNGSAAAGQDAGKAASKKGKDRRNSGPAAVPPVLLCVLCQTIRKKF